MADCAIIFDVDGVLLELTRDEEEIFFEALSRFVPTRALSRDWNSYRIRNDDDIISEILERNNEPVALKPDIVQHYLSLLSQRLDAGIIATRMIPGVDELLAAFSPYAVLGIATANLRQAAELRLARVNLWPHVQSHAQGADGGGHKRQILARLLERLPLPKSRIIYIGDNLNDVDAGLANAVHFIGFSQDPARRRSLMDHGAPCACASHAETRARISHILGL